MCAFRRGCQELFLESTTSRRSPSCRSEGEPFRAAVEDRVLLLQCRWAYRDAPHPTPAIEGCARKREANATRKVEAVRRCCKALGCVHPRFLAPGLGTARQHGLLVDAFEPSQVGINTKRSGGSCPIRQRKGQAMESARCHSADSVDALECSARSRPGGRTRLR